MPAPGPLREPDRHPGIEKIAEQHPDGAPRDHSEEDDLPGHLECPHQDGRHDHEPGHVVEHQAEKGVDVTKGKDAVALFHFFLLLL
ncbi:MAG TPA: hypothetical protein VHN12_10625 [Geobacteraceae bacterium]|nr:hypothetical protein [Geobacteraceae bacterium]